MASCAAGTETLERACAGRYDRGCALGCHLVFDGRETAIHLLLLLGEGGGANRHGGADQEGTFAGIDGFGGFFVVG